MKICWDSLENVRLTRTGNFIKGKCCLAYEEACKRCGEPYLRESKSHGAKYCSKDCFSKIPLSAETKLKISKGNKGKKISEESILKMSVAKLGKKMSEESKRKMSISHMGKHSGDKCPTWKGGVKKKKLPLYDTYAHQVAFADEVRPVINDDGLKLLEVKCSKCDNFYVPKTHAVIDRIRSLNGKKPGEQKFYCSQQCKKNCEVYGKRSTVSKTKSTYLDFTANELLVWQREVIKRANNICEYCGEQATQAHHIQPKKLEPFFALDPDNGIACCAQCHIKYAHIDECSTGNIANKKCK